MITIEKGEFEVSIEGHAYFDTPGKDIVCSAISILWHMIHRMMAEEEKRRNVGLFESERPGHCRMRVTWIAEGQNDRIKDYWDAFWFGIRLMENNYPTMVHIEEGGL